MCGIIGQISKREIPAKEFCLKRDTLSHRGPDGNGAVFLENDTIALGHTRLSFFDLSEKGSQPMSDATGNVLITFNGEIYNFKEIREELLKLGRRFETQTDTEVIIQGYNEWGIKVVDRLKGMFAFGLLDLRAKKLFLVRDRFGVKPLYYSLINGELIFASELKAIVKHADRKYETDVSAMADYFTYRYIPSPKTIWKDVAKLPPANYLEYDISKGTATVKEYWRISFEQKKISREELAHRYGAALEQSVMVHARADVPVGSFLSGGYDSSAIAYLLAKNNYKPETFSIGFADWKNSEDQFAGLVANKLGLNHHPLIVTEGDLNVLDIMPDVYDEPIADISILPTYLVSKNARRHVKAVMGGEGADELLGGYTWQKEWFAKKESDWKYRIFNHDNSSASEVTAYYANAMAMGRFDNAEQRKLFHVRHHSQLPEDSEWFYKQQFNKELSSFQAIQQMDIKCFMGELVLTKIDRASMANSLEVRVPFLDHELFELVLAYREQCYVKQDTTKYLLHENIKGHLPDAILQRQKQGFVGPDTFYMNMQWYESGLRQSNLVKEGVVNEQYCRNLLEQKDHWRLWKLLVMEKWFSKWAL